MHIEVISDLIAERNLAQLNNLLINAVNNDASIGWLPPLTEAEAEIYWRERINAVSSGTCILFVAWEDNTIIGSAQLSLIDKPNGNHRAEVQKVMVHTDYRRRGIAR